MNLCLEFTLFCYLGSAFGIVVFFSFYLFIFFLGGVAGRFVMIICKVMGGVFTCLHNVFPMVAYLYSV